jgi:N-acetylglucosaminyl-diphospho-decaprenol L-rhamnosyltransferase
VVDNGSGDGSAHKLAQAITREGWHAWASVLPLERNGGFASGCNAGIRGALAAPEKVHYVMLLNPDTVAQGGAIRTLLDFMESHPRAGVCGSRLEDVEGALQCSAHNAPSPLGELVSGARLALLSRALPRHVVSPPMQEAAHRCDWVSGASFMIRRRVLEEIGGLDEGYFLYFEEADFCARARAARWSVWCVPGSRVVHREGEATGIRDCTRRRPGYWFDSRRRYFVKHYGVPGLLAADALWAVGRGSLALRRTLGLGRGGDGAEPHRFARDLLWGDARSFVASLAPSPSRAELRR